MSGSNLRACVPVLLGLGIAGMAGACHLFGGRCAAPVEASPTGSSASSAVAPPTAPAPPAANGGCEPLDTERWTLDPLLAIHEATICTYRITWNGWDPPRDSSYVPDADGWISDYFIVGDDHARVFWNLRTNEVRARPYSRDRPVGEEGARAVAEWARETDFPGIDMATFRFDPVPCPGGPCTPESAADAAAGAAQAGPDAAGSAAGGEGTGATTPPVTRDILIDGLPTPAPCPPIDPARPLDGALTVAQAEQLADYHTLRLVGWVITLEQPCPPCPPMAECEACVPPYLFVGDLPPGVTGDGSFAWVDRSYVDGFGTNEPEGNALAVGQRIVGCGHWEPDWQPGTSRTFRLEQMVVLPAR